VSPAAAPTRSLPTGTVTFVFTDIEGSTKLLRAVGERYPRLLARHHEIVREQIARNGGVEVSTDGDAFFVAFASASPAVQFAIDAQHALAAEPWIGDSSVRVRAGIHTGTGELLGDTYVGIDVHRAARIAASAHGGQIVVSEATRQLLDAAAGTALRDLGEFELKDLPEPARLYQVVADGLRIDFPPLRTLDARRGNVPEATSRFVGRDAEVAAVLDLLETSRLVTLTGPGGTGKSRLSLEVARRTAGEYPDGAWFVALETVREPELVVTHISSALGVPEESGRAPIDVLRDYIGRKQLLIVLDNLEQVVAAGKSIGDLVASAPGLKAVASSREPLRVRGEQEFPVPPLPSASATELFVDRARRVQPDFDPGAADLGAIAEITDAIDGLPLAVELAAARVRLLTPSEIRDRLGDRLKLLSGGTRDAADRQRTIRGAIDWSYDLLAPDERTFFERMAVFAGHPTLVAISAVVDPSAELDFDAADGVELLLEKSLLVRTTEGGDSRFGFLQTVREYALEKLEGGGDVDLLRRRHAQFYATYAERIRPELVGSDPAPHFARLEADQPEFRALVEWSIAAGEPAIGMRACSAIWRFWQHHGHLAEGRALLESLLAASDEKDSRAFADAQTALGGVAYWQNDVDAAHEAYRRALAVNRGLGDAGPLASSLYDISFPMAIQGDAQGGRAALDEALKLYQEIGDEQAIALVQEAMAVIALRLGDVATARTIEQEVVAGYRRRGLQFKISDGLALLSAVCLLDNDVAGARAAIGESATIARGIGDRSAWATHLQIGALVALREGRPEDAAVLCGAYLHLDEKLGESLKPAVALGIRDPVDELRDTIRADDLEKWLADGRARDEIEMHETVERLWSEGD
jgi:predicted ATPase/class 3 adenylate cyclase